MQCLHASQPSFFCRSHQPAFQLQQQRQHRPATRVHAATTRAHRDGTARKQGASSSSSVAVQLTATSFSSRKLQASVDIHAPLPVVWEALTDYDNLGNFIPSLAENRCLERRQDGCKLYQVGAQDVAMGIKFKAACTLEITEYPGGIPKQLCTTNSRDLNRFFPCPPGSSSSSSGASTSTNSDESSSMPSSSYSSMSAPSSSNSSSSSTPWDSDEEEGASRGGGGSRRSGVRDISFRLVEGDFQAFNGIWRMQHREGDPGSTTLHYSLFVRPHPWLPVKLIEDRISSEVVNNLSAVRRHAERVAKRQQRREQQRLFELRASSDGGSSVGSTVDLTASDTCDDASSS